jgi:hypothetical protein
VYGINEYSNNFEHLLHIGEQKTKNSHFKFIHTTSPPSFSPERAVKIKNKEWVNESVFVCHLKIKKTFTEGKWKMV